MPGPCRAARPARCVAVACDARTVSRRVVPVRGSKRASRLQPASMTTRTPSSVRDVSAIALATTMRRRPSSSGRSAKRCCAPSTLPCSGRTIASGSVSESLSQARSISRIPGRKASRSPSSARQAVTTARVVADTMSRCACAPSQRISSGCCRPSLSMIGTLDPSRSAKRDPSMVADITSKRRSSRSTFALSSASASATSLSSVRSCASSNRIAETPGRSGSATMRFTRIASVITTMRVVFETRLSRRVA